MADRSIARELNELRRRLDAITKGQRVAHGAAIENASLVVRDDAGSLRAIYGQQADGTSGIQVVNGPPPPAPSAPIVASVLGGVTVSWDGVFAEGAVIPLDWSRVEVHASTSAGFTPTSASLQSTIETAQGATVVVVTDDPVYVRLLARNTSGAASSSSVEAGPFGPTPVFADDIRDSVVTEVKLANDAVTAAKIAAAAVGTTEISDDAVTTQKIVAGAILAGQIAAGAVLTDKLAAEAVTAAKIAALAITSDKIAANAIIASKIQAGAVDATAIAADAITGKIITGGTITGTDINGATVTGGTLRTAASGARVVVTPTPPAPVVQRPSVLLYSGAAGELFPGMLNAGAIGAQPITVLGSPTAAQDAGGNYTTAVLSLLPAKTGSYGGAFSLTTTLPQASSELGHGTLDAATASSTSGASYLSMTAKDGNATGAQSSVYVTGTYINVNANGSTAQFTNAGLTVPGTVTAQNTPAYKYKSSNTDRASTTTLTDDPDLTMNVVAGTYVVEFYLAYGGAVPLKTMWNIPAGSTGIKGVQGPGTAATGEDNLSMRSGSHNFTTAITYGYRSTGAGNLNHAVERGVITITTSGWIALMWAQNTTSATASRMGIGAWMRMTRIA